MTTYPIIQTTLSSDHGASGKKKERKSPTRKYGLSKLKYGLWVSARKPTLFMVSLSVKHSMVSKIQTAGNNGVCVWGGVVQYDAQNVCIIKFDLTRCPVFLLAKYDSPAS